MAGTEGKADPQNPNQLSRERTSSLVADILRLFTDRPGCKDWTNKLLAEMRSASGFDAGNISEILSEFSERGIIHDTGKRQSGSGNVIESPGYPIALTSSANSDANRAKEETAVVLMHEIIHWAGKRPIPGGGHTSHYSDAAMAGAWNRLGVVMSVAEYRRTFPDWVAHYEAEYEAAYGVKGVSYLESRLAGAGNFITCLDAKMGARILK
jgi:hypothetical protein